jgi:hypothetical protein
VTVSKASTWLVERNGITIGTASAPEDAIRITVGPESTLSHDDARELMIKTLALLGVINEGMSTTDRALVDVLQLEIHQREIAQSKLEAALVQLADLKAERAMLEAERLRLTSELGRLELRGHNSSS